MPLRPTFEASCLRRIEVVLSPFVGVCTETRSPAVAIRAGLLLVQTGGSRNSGARSTGFAWRRDFPSNKQPSSSTRL